MLVQESKAFFRAQTRIFVRMDFRTRLQEAMKLASADRTDLAEALGVSTQAVGMVLTGKSKALTAENCAKAARFLEVDPYWLATGQGEPRPKLMVERAALSPDAVEHALRFEKLTPDEQHFWKTLVDVARRRAAVGDSMTVTTPARQSGTKKVLGRLNSEIRTDQHQGESGEVNRPGKAPPKGRRGRA